MIIDLSGQRFGRLIALRYVGGKRKAWECRCDCGIDLQMRGSHLRTGKARSCGCFKAERMQEGLYKKHGLYGTPTYKTWDSMRSRCNNPSDPSYQRYGAKGIKVCDAWGTIDGFVKDMGTRPEGMSIDRIDPLGNYEPSNCRWATSKQQGNNRTNNRRVEYQGMQLTVREISDLSGADYLILRRRILKYSWSAERAVSEPAQKKRMK